MKTSSIEHEYNEINSRNGWIETFQVKKKTHLCYNILSFFFFLCNLFLFELMKKATALTQKTHPNKSKTIKFFIDCNLGLNSPNL